MRKIWFINEYDLPPEYTGTRRRYDMCKYLSTKKKYDLNILCGTFIHGSKNTYVNLDEEKKVLSRDGVTVYFMKGLGYLSSTKRIISMFYFFFKLLFFKFPKDKKPDIIYASSPHLFAALGSYFLSRKEQCKFLLEVRDLWPETWVQMGLIKREGVVHKAFLFLEKYLYNKAEKVIFLAPNIEYIVNLGISPDKIVFISNGVDLETFDKKSDLVIDLDKNKFNLTYTGSISVADNIDSLLELAKLIENDEIQINIIGRGVLKEELIKKVETEKIKNVIFYPSVQKNDVSEILRNSDILLIPTLDIGLYKYGISFNKLFEYWAAAKPIVFYGNVNPNYIEESNSGISIKNNDILGLKEAVFKLYNMSEEERNVLGMNGRKYVEENFDWKILADKVDSILEEVLQ